MERIRVTGTSRILQRRMDKSLRRESVRGEKAACQNEVLTAASYHTRASFLRAISIAPSSDSSAHGYRHQCAGSPVWTCAHTDRSDPVVEFQAVPCHKASHLSAQLSQSGQIYSTTKYGMTHIAVFFSTPISLFFLHSLPDIIA